MRGHWVVIAPTLSSPAEADNKSHYKDGERPGSREVKVRKTEQCEEAASHEDNHPLTSAGRLGREVDGQEAVEDTVHQTNNNLKRALEDRPGQVIAGVEDDTD